MARKIQGVLVDVFHGNSRILTLDATLDEYYSLLECELIDIQSRMIGGNRYDIICDDEALFHGDAKISAISNDGKVMFVGNLLVVKHNGEGGETSLTDDEAKDVMAHIKKVATLSHSKGYQMLVGCEF